MAGTEHPATRAASVAVNPSQAVRSRASRSVTVSVASASSSSVRSVTVTSAPGVDAAICSMRPIFSVSASRRRTLRRLLFTVFRATTNSHGSACSGTSSKRRQATRNVSETTSCAL